MSKTKIQLVAEIGCNHMGQFNLAKLMIDQAKQAGADYVKYQIFKRELGDFSSKLNNKNLLLTRGEFKETKSLKKASNISMKRLVLSSFL